MIDTCAIILTIKELFTVIGSFIQQQHPFNGPLSRITQASRYQTDKMSLDLLMQETVSGSSINWVICKSAPRSR